MAEPHAKHGRTHSGTAITDELVAHWSREAEAGIEPARLRRRGWSLNESAPFTSTPVRLDPELRTAVEQRAKRDGTTISEVIHDALRRHLDESS